MASVTHTALLIVIAFQFFQVSIAARCTAYMGGESTFFGSEVHRFGCCDNSRDYDYSCAGTTWQGGSSGNYCGWRGSTTWPNARARGNFYCPNCGTQWSCASSCSHWDFPGGCWCWINCFSNCCNRPRGKKRQAGFCGDGICNAGESPESCPMDCCGTVNEMCAITNTTRCLPECCSTPACCAGAVNGGITLHSTSSQFLTLMFFIFLLSFS